jgi:hypothetical protein
MMKRRTLSPLLACSPWHQWYLQKSQRVSRQLSQYINGTTPKLLHRLIKQLNGSLGGFQM